MGILSKGICNSSGVFLLLHIKYICGTEKWPVTVTYDKILITIPSSTGHCEAECMKTAVNAEQVLNHDGFHSLNRFHNEVAQDFYFNELPSSLPSARSLRRIPNGSLSLSILWEARSGSGGDLVLSGHPRPQDLSWGCFLATRHTQLRRLAWRGLSGTPNPCDSLKK